MKTLLDGKYQGPENIRIGTVLGRLSTGEYVPLNPEGRDGSQEASGVFFGFNDDGTITVIYPCWWINPQSLI